MNENSEKLQELFQIEEMTLSTQFFRVYRLV